MLVATTVSLLLIYSMAQGFVVVSETIRMNRAAIEVSSAMRQVTWRLQQDLDGVTVPVRPWIQSALGLGYFEYYDGPSNDLDADGDGTFDYTVAGANLALGDVDDVLMFTSRKVGSPFTGRVSNTFQKSEFAEVAWWLGQSDANQNGVVDPGEYGVLYRRALLIRPDLNDPSTGYVARLPANSSQTYDRTSQSDLRQMRDDLIAFVSSNDLSVRFRANMLGNRVELFAVANSLAELSLRQNRFCHDPVVYEVIANNQLRFLPREEPTGPLDLDRFFPHYLAVNSISHPGTGPILGALALQRIVKTGAQIGEDVMQSNVLAFDVRAFDPLAILSAQAGEDGEWGARGVNDDAVNSTTDGNDVAEAGWPGTDDIVVAPGDRGYGTLDSTRGTVQIASNGYILPIGRGAFVDLNFHSKFGIAGYVPPQPFPSFGLVNATSMALQRAREATFDTWPFDYEADGIDQDGDSLVDEGTDGVDSGNQGIDNEAERETSPPYSVPLRAVQASLRVLEPDTRQVFQSTVTTSFVPD